MSTIQANKKIHLYMTNIKNIWIKKAKEIHGDKYDYSKTDYINCIVKIIIICQEHGEFFQTPEYLFY